MISGEVNPPNCHDCRWRVTIPGDALIQCRHPLVDSNTPMIEIIIEVIEGKYIEAAKKLRITANKTGIRNGWFLWPANFDPVCLLTCMGFETKESDC